jgi:cephalosporin hydroxylase
MKDFDAEVSERIRSYADCDELRNAASKFVELSTVPKYSYNFKWMGRPIIQYPQDMVAVQELIWSVRPDLVVETGIAHGGSLVLTASIMGMMDMSDAIASGETIDPSRSARRVLGVDIDIRSHNRAAIEDHPMSSRISMIEGSSLDAGVIEKVHEFASGFKKVMVFLDSNHTHDHVLAELESYSGLVSLGSYCVVFDTLVENMPDSLYPDRPWGPGNNPKTAVHEFLKTHSEFKIDKSIDDKLLITVAPDGYLRRVQ